MQLTIKQVVLLIIAIAIVVVMIIFITKLSKQPLNTLDIVNQTVNTSLS